MSTTNTRRTVAATGAIAAALALWVPGTAAADQPAQQDARADLDGDHLDEDVTLYRSTEDTQVLATIIDGEPVNATIPADLPGGGVEPIRVTDLDGDRRDEALVAESVGANTVWYGLWHYRDGRGLVRVGTDDGHQLTVIEGGGVAARSGYACDDDTFATLTAEADDISADPVTYSGSRTIYELRDGIATPTDVIRFHHATADQSVMRVDPESCES
jgi:hypothetical protein